MMAIAGEFQYGNLEVSVQYMRIHFKTAAVDLQSARAAVRHQLSCDHTHYHDCFDRPGQLWHESPRGVLPTELPPR